MKIAVKIMLAGRNVAITQSDLALAISCKHKHARAQQCSCITCLTHWQHCHAEAQEFKAQYEASMEENAPLLGGAKPAELKEDPDKETKAQADGETSKAADELAGKVAATKVE